MKDQLNRYKKAFSEHRFWKMLQERARQAGIKTVYTALLLFYAYRRKETPTWAKSIVLGVLGYLVAPFDAIPDLTPIIGYTDDIGVLSFGLVTIAAFIDQDVRTKARGHLDKWFKGYSEEEIRDIDEQL